ncbi:MAG: hypothetical protein R3D85_07685 [Paracoccaceae bacterium]
MVQIAGRQRRQAPGRSSSVGALVNCPENAKATVRAWFAIASATSSTPCPIFAVIAPDEPSI